MIFFKAMTSFKAMTNLTSLSRNIIIPAVALAFVISACDSSDAIDTVENTVDTELFDVAQSVSFIAFDLELNSEEITQLQDAFDEHAGRAHEPGFLWNVAARLQANLTDEQKARIFARIENHPFPSGYFRNDHAGPADFVRRKGGFLQGIGGFGGLFDLTEGQREEMNALREEFVSNLRKIAESVKSGTLDRADARAQMKALADDLREAIDELLTDEQKALIEEKKAEFEARREARAKAEKEVMVSVLGLDDRQVAALEELRDSIDEDRLEFRELIENGATIDEVRALAEAARTAHNAALAGILDQTQYEIFIIHGALTVRMKMKRG